MRVPTSRPLRRLAAAATAAVLVATALTGCDSAVSASKGGSNGRPQQGGVLHVGTTVDLVPAAIFTNSNDTINTVIGQVFDSLIDYPIDSLDPQPRLATSWEAAKDGRSLTLELRKGVKFHDGKDFTSKDVEFSIRTWADPKWTVQFQRTAAAITGFDTSDPNRIVLKFDHPLSNIFDLLDVMPIFSEKSFDTKASGQTFVGTGPFKYGGWTPQSKIQLTRNDDYWDGKPYLEGVEIDIVPDAQSLVSQLRSGQLDVALGASNRDAASLAKSDNFTTYPFKGSERETYVGTNVTNPALKDVRVRQAIALAVDKQRIVDDVYRGVGFPISLPWPEYSPAYDAQRNKEYSRNVAKAKSLVAQVGSLPTFPLEYSTASPNNEAIAQIVQDNLAEVGIKVTLQPNENADHIEKLIGGKFPALWILDHAYAQYSPSTLAVTAYPFNADKNSSNFLDDKYKKDAVAAWELTDPEGAEATAAYKALNEDLLRNLFLIELNTTFLQAVAGNQVQDLSWTKRSELTLGKTWLDE